MEKKRHENVSREEGALSQKTWIKVRTYPPAPTQHLRPCSAIVILTSNMSARSFFKFSVSKWKTTIMTHIKALANITSPFFILLHIFCGCYVQAKFKDNNVQTLFSVRVLNIIYCLFIVPSYFLKNKYPFQSM